MKFQKRRKTEKEKPLGERLRMSIWKREESSSPWTARTWGRNRVDHGRQCGQATEHGRRKSPLTSAEKASLDTEKEQRVLEVGTVQHQRQRLILENRHFKRQFPVPDCISLFSTNSLPLPPHGSLRFEFPNFMMSELCFNVY